VIQRRLDVANVQNSFFALRHPAWYTFHMNSPPLYNEERTAQAAAYFLHMAGGRLPLLKLMKLLYLAERESYRIHGEPIFGDRLVSMPHGPVLSVTLNIVNDWGGHSMGGWNDWVEDRSGHELALRDPSRIRNEQDLRALSDDDVNILHAIWTRFGHFGKYELVEYTHSPACPEWEDPQGSSLPIPLERLLRAVGYNDERVASVLQHNKERENIQKIWMELPVEPVAA